MGGVGSRRVGKWSYPCLGNARSLHRERDIFPACHRLLSVHIFIATSSHAAILNSLGPYHQQFSKDQGRESHPESSDWHVTSVPVVTWSLTRILVSGEVGVLRRHGSSVVKSRSDHLGNTCPWFIHCQLLEGLAWSHHLTSPQPATLEHPQPFPKNYILLFLIRMTSKWRREVMSVIPENCSTISFESLILGCQEGSVGKGTCCTGLATWIGFPGLTQRCRERTHSANLSSDLRLQVAACVPSHSRHHIYPQ